MNKDTFAETAVVYENLSLWEQKLALLEAKERRICNLYRLYSLNLGGQGA